MSLLVVFNGLVAVRIRAVAGPFGQASLTMGRAEASAAKVRIYIQLSVPVFLSSYTCLQCIDRHSLDSQQRGQRRGYSFADATHTSEKDGMKANKDSPLK